MTTDFVLRFISIQSIMQQKYKYMYVQLMTVAGDVCNGVFCAVFFPIRCLGRDQGLN